jgi:hypothetical protein
VLGGGREPAQATEREPRPAAAEEAAVEHDEPAEIAEQPEVDAEPADGEE